MKTTNAPWFPVPNQPPRLVLGSLLLGALLSACSSCGAANSEPTAPIVEPPPAPGETAATAPLPPSAPPAHNAPSPAYEPGDEAVAYFAGGCFWCMEGPFEAVPGVLSVVSGYTDGERPNPSYRQVASGDTGHAEAIRVVYDPAVVTYAQLLEVFWVNIDPTDDGGQFCDRGTQYRTGIYVHNEEERRLAEASKAHAEETLGESIVTEIRTASTFYDAEPYHQNFYRTHPAHYTRYRRGCGRDRRLRAVWGDAAAHH